MPHFENIDKYESRKSPDGKKRIVPIAPHSLQAAEYRPRKSDRRSPKEDTGASNFEEVEFEPVSVRQMEKEYRHAARTTPRPRRKKMSLKKRIASLFSSILSIFKGKKKAKHRPRKYSPKKRYSGKRSSSENQRNQSRESGSGGKRRSRNRSRNPKGKRGQQGGGSQPMDGEKQEKPAGKGGQRKEGGRNSNRSRRGRRPSNRPRNKQGSPDRSPKKEN